MYRYWSLAVVAVAGILGGFALLAAGEVTLLAGILAAGSAYALLLPEFADSPAPMTGGASR